MMEFDTDTVYVRKDVIVGVYFDTNTMLPVIGNDGLSNGICVVAGSALTAKIDCSLPGIISNSLMINAQAQIGKFSFTMSH